MISGSGPIFSIKHFNDIPVVGEHFYALGGFADSFDMPNDNLASAKKARNDEFYTQYEDIEKEMEAYLEFNPDVFRDKVILLPCDDPIESNFTKFFAQNFVPLGVKKLISTSYAQGSKPYINDYKTSRFELESEYYDAEKSVKNGKIFVLTKELAEEDGTLNVNSVRWEYLEGDGDFRSEEVTKLRDEADMIVTNPPFSLFRDFVNWIMVGKKKFAVIGSMNAITYKEMFPLIKDNKMWLGANKNGGSMSFIVGADSHVKTGQSEVGGVKLQAFGNIVWFANIEHGRRHTQLELMTQKDNLRFNKAVREKGYQKYDNYDAIEVPRVDAIPSNYKGVMGVPISFLSKYNPDQFEILGSQRWAKSKELINAYCGGKTAETDFKTLIDGRETYDRIFIKHKKKAN